MSEYVERYETVLIDDFIEQCYSMMQDWDQEVKRAENSGEIRRAFEECRDVLRKTVCDFENDRELVILFKFQLSWCRKQHPDDEMIGFPVHRRPCGHCMRKARDAWVHTEVPR